MGSHHLAREFSRLGHSVLHICTPLTMGHFLCPSARERVAAWKQGVIRHSNGTQEIAPLALVPWQISRHFGLDGYMRSIPFLPGQIRQAGFSQPDLLLVDEPRMIGATRFLRPRRLVYRATDLYATMRSDPSVEPAEREAIRQSQGMIATAGPVLDHLRTYDAGKPSFLVENGVDAAHFSAPLPSPACYEGLPGPRLLYVGALDHRFDFEAVNSLARLAPDLQVIIAGPLSAAAPPRDTSLRNLHFLGPISYNDVPALMQHADIGLLPLNVEPSNRGRSPMKLYEYAAAGLPVVARKTAELERRAGQHIHLYEDVDGMVAAVRQILADRPDRSAIAASATTHSWSGKARQILDFVNGLPA